MGTPGSKNGILVGSLAGLDTTDQRLDIYSISRDGITPQGQEVTPSIAFEFSVAPPPC